MQNLSKEKLWELIHNYNVICSNFNSMEYMTDKEEQDQRNEEKNALEELNTFIDSLYNTHSIEHGELKTNVTERLEYLRKQLRNENISYAELLELQNLKEFIPNDDIELLQAAGIPEN